MSLCAPISREGCASRLRRKPSLTALARRACPARGASKVISVIDDISKEDGTSPLW